MSYEASRTVSSNNYAFYLCKSLILVLTGKTFWLMCPIFQCPYGNHCKQNKSIHDTSAILVNSLENLFTHCTEQKIQKLNNQLHDNRLFLYRLENKFALAGFFCRVPKTKEPCLYFWKMKPKTLKFSLFQISFRSQSTANNMTHISEN